MCVCGAWRAVSAARTQCKDEGDSQGSAGGSGAAGARHRSETPPPEHLEVPGGSLHIHVADECLSRAWKEHTLACTRWRRQPVCAGLRRRSSVADQPRGSEAQPSQVLAASGSGEGAAPRYWSLKNPQRSDHPPPPTETDASTQIKPSQADDMDCTTVTWKRTLTLKMVQWNHHPGSAHRKQTCCDE